MALVLCVIAPAVSFAAQSHPYTGVSFGPDGVSGSASFERVGGVALDPASGDVYVYDNGAGKVYRFDEDGNPVDFSAPGTNVIENVGGSVGGAEFGIAIAPPGSPAGTAGDIYVANNRQAIQVYAPNGNKLGEVEQGGETCGVATDPSGNFYAGVYSSTVNKYTPSANPPTTANKSTGTVEHGICNVAADGLGNVYAASYNGSEGLYKLEGIGDTTPTQVDPRASTMAIAPASNDLYADRENEVRQYDSSGALIGSFGSGDISQSQGVAINAGATKIYVGTPSKVKVFGSLVTVPDATSEAADAITKTTATLHGVVGAAGGPDATCVFQYVSNSQYAELGFEGSAQAPCSPAGPFTGSATTVVSGTATGLSAETGYRFRLLASSANGSNGGEALLFFTPGAVNVTTAPATAVTNSGATFNGTINPEGTPLEACQFEFGANSEYDKTVPCAETTGEIGTGNAAVHVHADIAGLGDGTEYQFRLVGKNEFGTNKGEESSFKTLGPKIEVASLLDVRPTTAKFRGRINPNGETTTYRFEYVSEADFQASGFANAAQLPAGGEAIGDGTDGVDIEREASGLTPRTTYHARLVAESAGGSAESEELVFTAFSESSEGLPDGRAYEQATPVDKAGTNPRGDDSLVSAADNGSGITFYIVGAGMPGADGSQGYMSYVTRRAPDGSDWRTQGLYPPADKGPSAALLGWSDDLSKVYVTQAERLGAPMGFYQLDGVSRTRELMVDGVRQGTTNYAAATNDRSELLLEVEQEPSTLPAGAAAGKANTFVWNSKTGSLTLAGVLNSGQAPTEGSSPGSFEDGGGSLNYTLLENPISDDGSRVFFSSLGTNHQVYLRQNPTAPQSPLDGTGACTEPADACTTLISAPEEGVVDPNGQQPATLWFATTDGSAVFFTSHGKLTADATTGPEDEGQDLYRYDVDTGKLTDLTAEEVAPNGAEVQGVLGISNDGAYVYFAANGVLAPGASPGDCRYPYEDIPEYRDNILEHTIGHCNLYVAHAGSTSFIARMNAQAEGLGDAMNWVRKPDIYTSGKTSRVSLNGRVLLFRSREKLTAYDNQDTSEFYRYSVDDATLQCVTCTPSGTAPVGPARLFSLNTAPGEVPGTRSTLTRNLSSDGNRVFFESTDKLVSTDINGENGCTEAEDEFASSCQDVYEWEANGTGTCQSSEQSGGCLYLLSSGTSSEPSYFGDASVSGNDAFIFTSQPLVRQDGDELSDIYDVRVGGGIASQNEPPPPICEGEACKQGATSPPASQSPGTASFSGPGDPKPSRHKKKAHKKKHGKKKHHKQAKKGHKQQRAHR